MVIIKTCTTVQATVDSLTVARELDFGYVYRVKCLDQRFLNFLSVESFSMFTLPNYGTLTFFF